MHRPVYEYEYECSCMSTHKCIRCICMYFLTMYSAVRIPLVLKCAIYIRFIIIITVIIIIIYVQEPVGQTNRSNDHNRQVICVLMHENQLDRQTDSKQPLQLQTSYLCTYVQEPVGQTNRFKTTIAIADKLFECICTRTSWTDKQIQNNHCNSRQVICVLMYKNHLDRQTDSKQPLQ